MTWLPLSMGNSYCNTWLGATCTSYGLLNSQKVGEALKLAYLGMV